MTVATGKYTQRVRNFLPTNVNPRKKSEQSKLCTRLSCSLNARIISGSYPNGLAKSDQAIICILVSIVLSQSVPVDIQQKKINVT